MAFSFRFLDHLRIPANPLYFSSNIITVSHEQTGRVIPFHRPTPASPRLPDSLVKHSSPKYIPLQIDVNRIHIRGKHNSIPRPPNAEPNATPSLSHIDEHGRPTMVNVGGKAVTRRKAVATGRIVLTRDAFDLVTGTEPYNRDPSTGRPLSTPDTSDPTPLSTLEKAKVKARSKGDVLSVAQVAGIMACKATSTLIPLCHPLPLTFVHVELSPVQETLSVRCTATVECDGKTGVEMEALTAVSVSLLTVWDMVKAVAGKEMVVSVVWSSFHVFV